MTESLGLSIGAANLVAARAGATAVSRTSVLTIFDNRAGEVGLPEENPNLNEPGLVMRGFVERVGDGSPLVAADGTKYLGEALTVEALEAMARTVGYGTPIAIAVPAYWSERQTAALRDEFFAQPALAPNGVPPLLISDATAALTALRTTPGFPTDGVVALCDFGASGTSITLSNAGSNFQQVGSSVRYTEFSGDEIDQLLANHLRDSGSGADTGSVRMASQARLLGACRRAKEALSGAEVATIATGAADIQLSRNEFEQLISGPLDRFVSTLEEILQRNGIRSNLAAVATVGGGASIPVLATRLSERLQVPILGTGQPMASAAVGAVVLAQQRSSAGAPTAAAPVIETPTQMAPAAPAAPPTEVVPTASVAPAPLAWSEDADEADEPVPYTGGEHSGEYAREAAQFDDAEDNRYAAEVGRLPWYKRTALVVTVAAALLAVLVAIVLALTLGHDNTTPVNTTTPPPPPPPQTVTITAPDNSTSTSVITPAPPPPPPPSTTYTPPPETTYQPTTTQPPPVTTTTQPPPVTTTTQPPPVTTTAPPTRERPFPRFEPPWRRGLG